MIKCQLVIDRNDYFSLVAKVRAIDPEAAAHMEHIALGNLQSFVYDGDLRCAFLWEETPQGHAFWQGIAEKLELYEEPAV